MSKRERLRRKRNMPDPVLPTESFAPAFMMGPGALAELQGLVDNAERRASHAEAIGQLQSAGAKFNKQRAVRESNYQHAREEFIEAAQSLAKMAQGYDEMQEQALDAFIDIRQFLGPRPLSPVAVTADELVWTEPTA